MDFLDTTFSITLRDAILYIAIGGLISWIPLTVYITFYNPEAKEVSKGVFLFLFFVIGYLFVEVFGIT